MTSVYRIRLNRTCATENSFAKEPTMSAVSSAPARRRFLATSAAGRPGVPAEALALLEFPSTFVGRYERIPHLTDVLESGMAAELERGTLPNYLGKRRWFAAKDQRLISVRIACLARLPGGEPEIVLSEVEVEGDGNPGRWLLPLSAVWAKRRRPLTEALALARIQGWRRAGLLTDAFSLAEFAHRMLECLATGAQISATDGRIVFEAGENADERLTVHPGSQVTWLSAEQSNSSLIVGDSVMLKIFRRIAPGQHPEAEMSRYLTENGFKHTPSMLGEVARIDEDGERHSLVVAQAFLANQGDAWTWTLDRFHRRLEDFRNEDTHSDECGDYTSFAAALGRRLGEMHVVLASATGNDAFSPRRATREDVGGWIAIARGALDGAFKALSRAKRIKAAAAAAQELLSAREAIFAALEGLAAGGEGSPVTRIHGDFHLGQVLVADRDAYIIDFEGEPSRDLAERRGKSSPLNDVAGLLRSFDYALATVVQGRAGTIHLPAHVRRKVLAPIADRARSAFLEAYRTSVRDLSGLEDANLLDLFLIRKAAYEIGYEAANRQEWLSLPVSGLAEIVRRVLNRREDETP
jgi:maltose alpha-D-glucosyltransferase/alpha-amylase